MNYTSCIYAVHCCTLYTLSYYVILIYHDACSTVLASTMLPATLRARPGSMATPRSWSWNKDITQPLAFNQNLVSECQKKNTFSYMIQAIHDCRTIWNLEYRSWDPLHHGDLKKSPMNAKLWAPARITPSQDEKSVILWHIILQPLKLRSIASHRLTTSIQPSISLLPSHKFHPSAAARVEVEISAPSRHKCKYLHVGWEIGKNGKDQNPTKKAAKHKARPFEWSSTHVVPFLGRGQLKRGDEKKIRGPKTQTFQNCK